MSAILKALKRLESSSAPWEEISPISTGAKKTIRKSGKEHRFARQSLSVLPAIILCIALLSLGRTFLWSGRETAVSRRLEGNKLASAPVQVKRMPLPSKRERDAPPRFEGRKTAEPAWAGPDNAFSSESASSRPAASGSTTTAPFQAQRPASSTGSAHAGPRELDMAGYRLGALVWSDDPASRFVVINDKIVKIGESVGGAIVKEIGKDHVDLESGGRTGSLVFRGR